MKLTRSRLLSVPGAVLAAAGIAVLASGCGSTSATLDPVAQAAEVTSATGGVHMLLTMQVNIPGVTSSVTATGGGFFNYKTREGEFSIALSGLPAAASTALHVSSIRVNEVMKSTALYVGSPLLAGRLPGGARWLKIDLSKIAGLDLQSLTSGESNPAQFLEYLRAHGSSVSTVGSETIDGVQTTHYRGSIDLRTVAEALPQSERSAARAALQTLISQTGVSSIPFDAWVDDQHRVRRMEMNIAANVAGHSVGIRIRIDLSGFGRVPKVTAPPSSEVFSAPPSVLEGAGA